MEKGQSSMNGAIGYLHAKTKNQTKKKTPHLSIRPYTKFNLKWVIDLKVKAIIIRLLEENRRKSDTFHSALKSMNHKRKKKSIK